MTEAELRALGWRTFGGIVSAFVAIPVPLFLIDLESPQFSKLAVYVGAATIVTAWIALCTVLSKRLWRL